jgi:hypothetical protein
LVGTLKHQSINLVIGWINFGFVANQLSALAKPGHDPIRDGLPLA